MLQYKDSDKFNDFINAVEDTEFWDKCARLEQLLLMPSKLIGEAESDGSNLSHVYTYFQKLLLNPLYSDMELLAVKQRWEFIHTESMGYAYFFNPVNEGGLGMVGSDLDDTLDALDIYIEMMAHNEDHQVQLQRELDEFKAFVVQPGDKNRERFKKKGFCPRSWWLLQGRNNYPNLYRIATRVLSVPTSSAASERVWSVFNLIHTKKRCRLKNSTVNQLAYVYVNSQFLSGPNHSSVSSSIDYFLQQVNEEEFTCLDDGEEDKLV
jgi:hypothetical protein